MQALPKTIDVYRAFMAFDDDGHTIKGISYHTPAVSMTIHELMSRVASGKSYEFLYLVNPSNIDTLVDIEGQEGPKDCLSEAFKVNPLQNSVLMYKNSKGQVKFSKKFLEKVCTSV